MRLGWLKRKLPGTNGQEFIAAPYYFYNYPNGGGMVLNRLDNSLIECSKLELMILDSISECAGENEQIENISLNLKLDPRRIESTIAKLHKSGLVLFQSDIYTKLKEKVVAPAPGKKHITHFMIVTRNRPIQATEGLLSFIRSASSSSRNLRFSVIDDTDTPDFSQILSSTLHNIAKETNRPIGLTTSCSKAGFIAALKKEALAHAIPESCVSTAFEGILPCGESSSISHGKNRNFALAAGMDEVSIWNDDDILPLYAKPKETCNCRILCSSEYNLHLTKQFLSREQIIKEAGLSEIDWLDAHESLLGPAAALLTDGLSADKISYDGMSMDFLKQLLAGKTEVIATNAGACGEYAGKPPNTFLYWPISTQGLTLNDREAFYTELLSGELFAAPPAATVTNSHFFTGMQSAINGERLLPPFFPHFTGEDSFFGLLVRKISPDYLFAHLPYGVFHNRKERRTLTREAIRLEYPFFSMFLSLLLNEFPNHNEWTDPVIRMKAIGEHIRAFGDLEEKRFLTVLREVYARNISYNRMFWELVKSYQKPAPGFWLEDLRAYQENQLRYIEAVEMLPLELANGVFGNGFEVFRLCLRRYGELLCYWPQMAEIIKRLKNGTSWFIEEITP